LPASDRRRTGSTNFVNPLVFELAQLAQQLAVEGAARSIDMQIRAAQSAVPVPRSIPGVPRF
jgi:hypothetical protein